MQLLHFKRQKLPFEGCYLFIAPADWSGLRVSKQSLILTKMEYFFACPYCCEQISMVLDTSVNGQTYVEDCEVCCRPIEVRYTTQDGEVNDFEARTLE